MTSERGARHGGLLWEWSAELRYVWYSLYLAYATALGLALGVVSAFSLNGVAKDAVHSFENSVQDARDNGVDVYAMLNAPLNVDVSNGQTSIDNPLRYDFEAAWRAVGMLSPAGYAANALQFVGVLVVPIVAVAMGTVLSTKDYRFRTIQLRAVRSGVFPIVSSHLLAAIAVVACTALGAAVGAGVTGVFVRAEVMQTLNAGYFRAVSDVMPVAGALGWAAFAVLSGVLFAVIGIFLGLSTRLTVVPLIVFTAFHLAVPMLGAGDPRSLLLVAAAGATPFEGTLMLRPVANTLSPLVADGVLAICVVVLCAVSVGIMRLRPRWGAG